MTLIDEIQGCQICADKFTHDPNPIFQIDSAASILIAGQAPGKRVHESGIPFKDASGDRLRHWMAVSEDEFYDVHKFAILPMGFCYPGKGKSGDLAPRTECAIKWRSRVMELMPSIKLILLVGSYAINWHLGTTKMNNLTDTVRSWKLYFPEIIPLPHPSPRNNIWLKKNNWFEKEVLPEMQPLIRSILNNARGDSRN
jgi:uracil-DNA glycosylase